MNTFAEGRSLIIKVGNVIKFLKEQGINSIPNFRRELFESSRLHSYEKFPGIYTFEAVFKMCNYWKKYCADQTEFSKLVCKKILCMVKFHEAVITSNSSDEKNYLGDLCKTVEELPNCTTTVTNSEGVNSIQEGLKTKFKEF